MKTFDNSLTDEQKRKAAILRNSIKIKDDLVKRDFGAKKIRDNIRNSIKRFDDVFAGNPADLSRASELRKRCKAEMYWEHAGNDEKEAIRNAIVEREPYRNNELFTNHFMGRRLNAIIKDDNVLNYIIIEVLAL